MSEKKLDQYAVFGNPIVQSKSPQIHMMFAEQSQQALAYDKHCVEVGDFAKAAGEFFQAGGKGLNITAPFKHDAYEYADSLSERAKTAGAVNTLAKQEDGSILGDNTDGKGLVIDITERLGWPMKDKKILILGAGGAVRGVLYPILQQQPELVHIANRTVSKAQALADIFSDMGNIQAREFYREQEQSYDIIINGTSASLSGDLPPLNAACITDSTSVYDMVYGKELTPFLNWAKEQGAKQISDGLGMLVGQAAESFYIWRGVRPEITPVIQSLK